MLRVIVVMKELKNRRVHGVFTQPHFVILIGLGGLKKRCRERWFYGL